MDLRISIVDEQEEQLDYITIYQDGSDSEGTQKIRKMLSEQFEVEAYQRNVELDYKLCEILDITTDELDTFPLEYVEKLRRLQSYWTGIKL